METHGKIKVIIADDHDIYLDGLKHYFEHSPTYELVGEARNGEELLRKTKLLQPNLVITDLKMPLVDGPTAIREIIKFNPAIRCIVLTSYENELSIIDALEAGARGYLTKNMPKEELFDALDLIRRGYPYYCRTTSTKMVRMIGRSQFNPYRDQPAIHFTDNEKKLIRLVCEEYDNKAIAEKLSMSVRTVEKTRSRIFKKIGAKTTAGIAIYAIKNALYFVDE